MPDPKLGVDCSILVPVYNEEAVLPEFCARMTAVMERSGCSFEILFVNDGSRDKSLQIMRELRRKDSRVSLINLSRNFGHQIAVSAGLDFACGKAVVIIDADLQDPPEVVLQMIERWKEGYDVVYGVRTRRDGETVFKRASAALFYRFLRRFTRVDIPVDTGDFRLMSRRVVEAMNSLQEKHRFIRGLVAWLGYRQIGIPYERAARYAGETKYPLAKMMRLAVDAIIAFSFAPMRWATTVGVTVSFAAFAYIAYAVYLKLVLNITVQGWTSTMVAVLFIGGVQLIFLGVIGEYLGRVFDEVKRRPLYLIEDRQQGPDNSSGESHG